MLKVTIYARDNALFGRFFEEAYLQAFLTFTLVCQLHCGIHETKRSIFCGCLHLMMEFSNKKTKYF